MKYDHGAQKLNINREFHSSELIFPSILNAFNLKLPFHVESETKKKLVTQFQKTIGFVNNLFDRNDYAKTIFEIYAKCALT